MGERILDLLRQGISYNAIAAEVGCSKSNVNYYAKKLGTAKKARIYDWKVIQSFHDHGNSIYQCMKHFGFCKAAWQKAVERGELVPRIVPIIPMEDLLVNGRRLSGKHLKTRLFRAGLMEQHCHECGLVEWRGKKLPLELHHINGVHDDNRRENLTLLCPNCHSLTPNYCGKNTKRRKTGIR